MRRLLRGGAAGQTLIFSRQARRVERILLVTLEIFATKRARHSDGEVEQPSLTEEPFGRRLVGEEDSPAPAMGEVCCTGRRV